MKKLKLVLAAAGAFALAVAVSSAVAHGPGPVHAPTGRVVKVKGQSPELTIVHIVQGCHNWTDGSKLAEKAQVTMRRGGKVTILNQDVDVHKLVQLAGPHVATGAKMPMNKSVVVRFARAGTYRFKTVTSEMEGMPEMKTMGPDYRLLLTVTVK
jgi:hypothetical protein